MLHMSLLYISFNDCISCPLIVSDNLKSVYSEFPLPAQPGAMFGVFKSVWRRWSSQADSRTLSAELVIAWMNQLSMTQ